MGDERAKRIVSDYTHDVYYLLDDLRGILEGERFFRSRPRAQMLLEETMESLRQFQDESLSADKRR